MANVLYLNILNIMTTIFSISSAMAKEVFTIDAPDLKVEDMDIGSALFYQLFGLLFILAAIVCSFLMLWTVYSRYIKLYLLMILAPFAMSALVGGQEIEQKHCNIYGRWVLGCVKQPVYYDPCDCSRKRLQCISVKGDGIINVINVPDFGTGKERSWENLQLK